MDPRTLRRWALRLKAMGCPYESHTALASAWHEGFMATQKALQGEAA